MQIISKALELSKEEYFKKHLLVISPLLPIELTEKEIEVLAAFLMLEEDLKDFVFETSGRKEVRNRLQLSHGGLGNYIRRLKDKGYLLEQDGKTRILDILKPQPNWQGYQFKLSIKNGV